MKFKTLGNRNAPAVLFFHAMGVTGESSEPVAKYLQDRYFCILPTSTVYCKGQKYASKADEVRQVEAYLKSQGVEHLELVVASSIGADLAMAFLTGTKLPIGHVFFDGGQFAQIAKGTRHVRGVQLRKHSKAREKRYSFGYAVSFIFACYQILWTFPKSLYLCSRYLLLAYG